MWTTQVETDLGELNTLMTVMRKEGTVGTRAEAEADLGLPSRRCQWLKLGFVTGS